MKNEWLSVVSRVATVRLALESLRAKDTARALELLERDLDASILELAALSNDKDLASGERRLVPTTLQQIRTYRSAHPRRVEADIADINDLGNGLVGRTVNQCKEMAGKILEEL